MIFSRTITKKNKFLYRLVIFENKIMFFQEHSYYVTITYKGGIVLIKVNLNKFIEKNNLNINQLSKETGISRKALTSLVSYNDSSDPPVSIQYHTIDVLCKYFKIGVDDLITYEYNQKDFAILSIPLKHKKDKNVSLFLLIYNTVINGSEKVYFIPVVVGINEIQEPEVFTEEVPRYIDGKIEIQEKESITPRFINLSFEVVLDKFYKNIEKHLKITDYFELIESEKVTKLTDEEVAYLMKSFSKKFLAELTARFFDKDIINIDSIETQISLNWNLGYYSFMHSGDFHFEYSVHNNTIVSMDDDSLTDPLNSIVTMNYGDELEKRTYPNIFKL